MEWALTAGELIINCGIRPSFNNFLPIRGASRLPRVFRGLS
ncbi:MAG TPA: hypothetical protein VFC05_14765 [Nitrososphaeraceae archaeon]|nr:hypothetical protein [Nitrososphaeraceae archaeon]